MRITRPQEFLNILGMSSRIDMLMQMMFKACLLSKWYPVACNSEGQWRCLRAVCTTTYHPLHSCAGPVIFISSVKGVVLCMCLWHTSVRLSEQHRWMMCCMLTLLKQALLSTRAMQQTSNGAWVLHGDVGPPFDGMCFYAEVVWYFTCAECLSWSSWTTSPDVRVDSRAHVLSCCTTHIHHSMVVHDMSQSSTCCGRIRNTLMSLLSSWIKTSSLIAYWCMLHACEDQQVLLNFVVVILWSST